MTQITATDPTKGNDGHSGYERADADWYREPPWAVEALLKVEQFEGLIWDPACGGGNIPETCRTNGLLAFGTDIIQRGPAEDVRDFLTIDDLSADHVITNPPFKLATQFAIHAMSRVTGKVAILQQTAWLEGQRRHSDLWSRNCLAAVWQFRRRVSMPPGTSGAPAEGGKKAYAWFVFSASHGSDRFMGGWL